MTLDGTLQLERTTTINAPADAVWEVLSDTGLLADWAPVVVEVTSCAAEEGVGAMRSCNATLAGRSGRMVERCVEYTPTTRIAYVVDDESFGMGRMFDHYGFAINLRAAGSDRTRITLQTHYTPRNLVYAALNAVAFRRRFRTVCDDLIGGLKRYVEARHRTPVDH